MPETTVLIAELEKVVGERFGCAAVFIPGSSSLERHKVDEWPERAETVHTFELANPSGPRTAFAWRRIQLERNETPGFEIYPAEGSITSSRDAFTSWYRKWMRSVRGAI